MNGFKFHCKPNDHPLNIHLFMYFSLERLHLQENTMQNRWITSLALHILPLSMPPKSIVRYPGSHKHHGMICTQEISQIFSVCCLLLSQAFLIDFAFVFLTKETSLHSSMTYIHLKNGAWFQPAKAFLYPFTSIFSNVVMVKHLLFSNLII